jgi:uncharacterized protein YndB with AHSA1/START domain
MTLADALKAYLEITAGFERPMHLSWFRLSKAETERVFSAWDEDYQISRFMLLTRASEEDLAAFPVGSRVYVVNGQESSHVTFRVDIQRLLKSP